MDSMPNRKPSRPPKKIRQGYTQIHMGSGYGKSLAIFGLAVRMSTYRFETFMARFRHDEIHGYTAIRELLPKIKIELFGLPGSLPDIRDVPSGNPHQGITRLIEALKSGSYALVIADGVLDALTAGWITESETKDLIRAKPRNVELVMTGTSAPLWLIDKADLVTERVRVEVSEYVRTHEGRTRKGTAETV